MFTVHGLQTSCRWAASVVSTDFSYYSNVRNKRYLLSATSSPYECMFVSEEQFKLIALFYNGVSCAAGTELPLVDVFAVYYGTIVRRLACTSSGIYYDDILCIGGFYHMIEEIRLVRYRSYLLVDLDLFPQKGTRGIFMLDAESLAFLGSYSRSGSCHCTDSLAKLLLVLPEVGF